MGVMVKARQSCEGDIHRVQRICCEAFGVTLIDLLSDRRCKDYVTARHIAMWLIRKHTTISFPVIGRMFRRDHSTVILACRNAEKLIAEDETIKQRAYECFDKFEREKKELECTSSI